MESEASMKRSRRILVVCHCILNANSKVYHLASTGGVHVDILKPYLEAGTGIVQLPCPELTYLGMNRWGMTREQYDHANFRTHCEKILEPAVLHIEAFIRAGYEIIGIMGMDGSPNCGVSRSCIGYEGGEIRNRDEWARQANNLRTSPGRGVFMEVLQSVLEKKGISSKFFAVDEEGPLKGA
jgi:predicted secreted protein